MYDQLRDRPAGSGRVHHAVSREAAHHEEVVHPAIPRADDRIAVELVLLVEAGPGPPAPASLELGKTVRERGPHDGLEIFVVAVEVVAAGLAGIHQPAGKALALGPEREPLHVLHVRQWLE